MVVDLLQLLSAASFEPFDDVDNDYIDEDDSQTTGVELLVMATAARHLAEDLTALLSERIPG